jgi:polysaccharide biosynthesis PFTS motif protein
LKKKTETEAYSKFLLTGKLLSIRKFRQELVYFETKSINSVPTKNKKYLINDEFTAFSTIQILCNNLLNNQKFIRSFIKAKQKIHKIWYPMPSEWINIFNKDEIIVNGFICSFLWKFYCIKKYSQLLINILNYFINYLIYKPIKFRKHFINFHENYIYINNFHSNLSEIGDFNFINWLKNQENYNNHRFVHCNNEFRDSKKVTYYPNFFMPTSVKDRIKLFAFALGYIKHYVSSPELKYGFNLNIEDLFLTYYLLINYKSSNNIFIFREEMRLCTPIWVRYAHSLNQKVICIEQSQSIEPDLHKDIQMEDDFEKLVIWPEVWTVTEERIQFLQKYDENKTKKYRHVGLPWMYDLARPILNFDGISISVFDVEPHQGYFGVSTYNLFGLHEIKYSLVFLEDIVELANKFGFKIFHKPKRNIAAKRYTEYQQLLESLTIKFPKNYMLLKPETSIKLIAENTNFIIATPFTSAIYAGEFSKARRIYYDPLETGISSSRDSLISVVYGRKALNQWFNQISGA